MAPTKNHAVGDSCKIGVYMVHMLHFDGKLIKIIKEHMCCYGYNFIIEPILFQSSNH
jgi:hypothetical protein